MRHINTKVKARLEQFNQARRIHGGTMNMCAAAMGVKLSRLPIPSRKIRERVYRTIYGKQVCRLARGRTRSAPGRVSLAE